MRTRIVIFITLLCSIVVNAQIKVTFYEREYSTNYIELGVALKNFMGNKKFNELLSSGDIVYLWLTINAQGEVQDIEPIRASRYREDSYSGNESLNIEKFKKYLREKNYSFTQIPMVFSDMRYFELTKEDAIFERGMYSYLPCTRINVQFSQKWIDASLRMYSGKTRSMFELFNSNSPFIERGAYISENQMIDSLEITPDLYNSEIAALGFLYILGEYGFNNLMKIWNGEYTLEFNVVTDRDGCAKKITSLNTYGTRLGHVLTYFDHALLFNNDIFKKRLLYYFQNHHFKFKNTDKNNPSREITVKFPGKLLSLCNNTEEKPDWVSSYKVEQVAASIYTQECKQTKN